MCEVKVKDSRFLYVLGGRDVQTNPMASVEIINLDEYQGPDAEFKKDDIPVVKKGKKDKKVESDEPEIIDPNHPTWKILK